MNEKKRQAAYAMIEYIDNYYRENRHTPSLREIEAELGFSRQSALRYLQELDMEGVVKYDGDLVVIEQTDRAEYCQIVAALDENNGSTLKRLVYDKKKKRPVLHPENSSMKDICPDEIVVQGVAVKVIKDLP